MAALLIALVALTLPPAFTASAQATGGPVNGVVVGVETNAAGNLTRFAVSDSSGQVHEFTVSDATQFGLENQAGDRWVSTLAEAPAEAATRLRDHQQRFAPVTVTTENGTAASVVERESGKLETNLGYLFAVFAVTWAGFFGYIFWISRKQNELQRELARLRAALTRATGESK